MFSNLGRIRWTVFTVIETRESQVHAFDVMDYIISWVTPLRSSHPTPSWLVTPIRAVGMLGHFSCVWLCGPVDCSPPGSSVHGILQARRLGRADTSFARGSSRPRNWNLSLLGLLHWQVGSLSLVPLGGTHSCCIELPFCLGAFSLAQGTFKVLPSGVTIPSTLLHSY